MHVANGTARLAWTAEEGFLLELDCSAPEDVEVRMAAVAVPADGTRRLNEELVDLFPLDILFKAHVDVDGGPGQLLSAKVGVSEGMLRFVAVVEDADTGETLDVDVRVALEMSDAPVEGGFVPVPPEEDELDWEDEHTLEQMISDPPAPSRTESPPPVVVEDDEDDDDDEGGFAALLRAIVSIETTPEAEDGAGPPVVSDPGDARGLLSFLVSREELELAEGHDVDELVAGAAPIVAREIPGEDKASMLSNWLFTQDAVEELYIDDESLANLLDQW